MSKKQKSDITLDTIVQRDLEQEFSKIDDEVVMLSLKNGEYYALNEVASRIWELLEKKNRIKDIILVLLKEYHITEAQCEKEALEYIIDLRNKGLLI